MNAMNEPPLLDSAMRSVRPQALPGLGSKPVLPSAAVAHRDLESILNHCGPIPPAAAFLGIAFDGLPVLLNLRDPSPGPILISGHPGSGKRRLLQVIARFADFSHPAGQISHVVLTDHLRDWDAFARSFNCEGVLPFHHALTANYISSLASIGRSGRASHPYLLLIVDGLDILASESALRLDMLWLFKNGPTCGIWPIATVNLPHTPGLSTWLQPFRTVLCSRSSATGAIHAAVPSLRDTEMPPSTNEFALLSGDDWLPFWVPEPL